MSILQSDPAASHSLVLTANTVATWNCPVEASEIIVIQQTAGDTWITVNGPAPTVGGDQEWFLPAGDGVGKLTIPVAMTSQREVPTGYTGPVVQAITATAGSIYLQAD